LLARVSGDPRKVRLSAPSPQSGAPCGVVDLLDFPINPPSAEVVFRGQDFKVSIFAIDINGVELARIFTGGSRIPMLKDTWAFAIGDDRILANIGGGSMVALDTRLAIEAVSQATNTPVPPADTPESTATASPAPAPADSGSGMIAFVSTRDGNGEIYVMNADGSNPRRLTNWRDWDGLPDWSPDGRQIAFYTYLTRRKWAIQVMDADGSNQRRLTDNGICDGAPHWSPDGTRIAFTSDAACNAEHGEIYVMDADGSNPRNLTNNDADDLLASWSPDGTQLVFSSDRDGNYEIYVMDADDSNPRRLTDNDDDEYAPAWSPDGASIAFYSDRDGNEEIYVMEADGSNPQRLTNNPAADWFPRWSPDGTQMTFSSWRDGNLEIYVMNADGSNPRRLTDNPAEDFNSVWQPLPTGGASTPVPAVSFEQSAQNFPSVPTFQIGLGDLDGDGDLDAVFANAGSNYSQVWLNEWAKTLRAALAFT